MIFTVPEFPPEIWDRCFRLADFNDALQARGVSKHFCDLATKICFERVDVGWNENRTMTEELKRLVVGMDLMAKNTHDIANSVLYLNIYIPSDKYSESFKETVASGIRAMINLLELEIHLPPRQKDMPAKLLGAPTFNRLQGLTYSGDLTEQLILFIARHSHTLQKLDVSTFVVYAQGQYQDCLPATEVGSPFTCLQSVRVPSEVCYMLLHCGIPNVTTFGLQNIPRALSLPEETLRILQELSCHQSVGQNLEELTVEGTGYGDWLFDPVSRYFPTIKEIGIGYKTGPVPDHVAHLNELIDTNQVLRSCAQMPHLTRLDWYYLGSVLKPDDWERGWSFVLEIARINPHLTFIALPRAWRRIGDNIWIPAHLDLEQTHRFGYEWFMKTIQNRRYCFLDSFLALMERDLLAINHDGPNAKNLQFIRAFKRKSVLSEEDVFRFLVLAWGLDLL
ncbi:hypothetical protein VNI00_000714 [Paramarasmius palmivorus]|uniref:F-box domain-containing protein n=1 Tax=Paramarasmius palmivorus TaxID=297713 RepID=A0AAW0EA71_9AGAR